MKKNSFLKNVLVLILSQGIIKVVGIVYKLYLTNKNGYADTGNAIFFAAFQVYTIFLTTCSIGVPNAISSLVSARFAIGESQGAYRVLKIAIVIFGTIGFTASCLLYVFSGIISNCYLQMPETKYVLEVLAPSIFIVAITSVLKGYFNGKQKMNITANSLSIEQIIKTIVTIILVEILANASKNNTLIMVCTVGITTTIGNCVSFIYIYINYLKSRQEIWADIITSKSFKKERKRTIIKSIFKVSFPIAVCTLIGTLNKTIDAITIVRIAKKYLGEVEAVRQYGILSGKIESLIIFPLSFNMAFATTLIPAISTYKAKKEMGKAKKILKLTILAGIIIGIPCFVIMFQFPTEIISALFPYARDGSLMLKYSSFTIIMALIMQTINSYLQGMNKMGIQIVSIGIGSIIKLVLNIVLVQNSKIGIYGAIYSNIASYTFILIWLISYLIRKEKIKFEFSKFIIKPFFLILFMYIILKYVYKINIIYSQSLKLFLTFFITGIAYTIIVSLLKIITKEDIRIIENGKHKT